MHSSSCWFGTNDVCLQLFGESYMPKYAEKPVVSRKQSWLIEEVTKVLRLKELFQLE